MSASHSGQGQSGDRPQDPRREALHPPVPEAPTDPGRAQPFESLYRGPADSPKRVHRTTARHYEPSSTPPEEHPPGDTYHWLYRNDEPATVGSPTGPGDLQAAPSLTSSAPETGDATRDHAHPGLMSDDRGPTDGSPVGRAADADGVRVALEAAPPDQREASGTRRLLAIVLLVVLLVALVIGAVVVVLGRQDPAAAPGPSVVLPSRAASTAAGPAQPGSSSASGAASTPEATAGKPAGPSPEVAPVEVVGVRASCQARPSTDGRGSAVSYRPELAADQDASTAWRCDGSGRSQTLTFSFAAATRVSEVGLINGYAKVDPATKADRYDEYRRITQVRWTFPSGSSFVQDLEDDEKALQKLSIATQSTDRVQLTVTRSTTPGSQARTRDAVLVSEVSFAGPAS